MKLSLLAFIPCAALPLLSQTPNVPGSNSKVMVVGVAHDNSVMGGGISGSNFLKPGTAAVQPIAWLTPSGDWLKLPCYETNTTVMYSTPCHRFEREYLSKPHTYTVVSEDGRSASVNVLRMDLDQECFGIGGDGKFSSAAIRYAAVAAESADMFSAGDPARRLPETEAAPISEGLTRAVGKKLDSTKELRVYSVSLEGADLVVIQRAFQDYANKYKAPEDIPAVYLIFAIGAMENGRFRLLHWKENTRDANEQILGLIRLKSGRDFLVTTTSDPEGDWFTVYGIRAGKLTVVFNGGGGGC